MAQILPPRGFRRTDTVGPLTDPALSGEEYRLWKIIDYLAWDGAPFEAASLEAADAFLGTLLHLNPRTIRRYRSSLVARGLVHIGTSGGMTTLEAGDPNVQNTPVHATMDEDNSGEQPRGPDRSGQQWPKLSGQMRPVSVRRRDNNKSNSSSSSCVFEDSPARSGQQRPDLAASGHVRPARQSGDSLSPELDDAAGRLNELGIFYRPALTIARRGLDAGFTPDELLDRARATIRDCDNNIALAVTRLVQSPLKPRHNDSTKRLFREMLD